MNKRMSLGRTVVSCLMAWCVSSVAWADGVKDMSCAAAEDGHYEGMNHFVGFWREESLASVSENQALFRPNVHYKFYLPHDMVALNVSYNDGGDKNVSFSGRWGKHGYLSDTAVMEFGDTLKIKMKGTENFDLWWSQRSVNGETTYQEGWTRTFVPMGLSEVMERTLPGKGDSKFAGLWRRKWLRQPVSGELIETNEPYYKVYGDGCFILYMIRVSRPDRFVSFQGRTGTFEVVSDTEIKENGGGWSSYKVVG